MNDWISVKDELPKTEECCIAVEVIAYCSKNGVCPAVYRPTIESGWTVLGRYGGFRVKTITHWMHYPEKPTEKDKL